MANSCKGCDIDFQSAQTLSFPQQLHRRLHRSRNIGNIISFQVHGRAFRIHDEARFRDEVLPVWFENLSWEGFQQELRRYGFRQIVNSGGRDEGAYYHELFLRGQAHLLQQMRPSDQSPTVDNPEPDFTRMPSMGFEEIADPVLPFLRVVASADRLPWHPPDLAYDIQQPNGLPPEYAREAMDRDRQLLEGLEDFHEERRRQNTGMQILADLRHQDATQRQQQEGTSGSTSAQNTFQEHESAEKSANEEQ